MNRFKGIAYPLKKHPRGFFHAAESDVAQVKASMAAIILTEPGERVFEPHFGTALSKVNLNAPLEIARNDARMKVATSLKNWEKRVQVIDVIVDLSKSEEKLILKIQVLFIDPINIKTVHNLTLYKSLGGIDGRTLPF
jgi:phage baseplate assembly protein W